MSVYEPSPNSSKSGNSSLLATILVTEVSPIYWTSRPPKVIKLISFFFSVSHAVPLKTSTPTEVRLPSTLSPLAPSTAVERISSPTSPGIVNATLFMSESLLQNSNALSPIFSSLDSLPPTNSTLRSDEHPLNALAPISVMALPPIEVGILSVVIVLSATPVILYVPSSLSSRYPLKR